MASIHVNNADLEYFEDGDGEPLVLVHGSASDHRIWHSQFKPFSKHFRTIKYSRRYHWPNRPISDEEVYSMPEHVDDLEALLSALDAVPAHLVGHSYGGFLCLLLAIKKPSLVRSLVLSEPPVLTLFASNTPKPAEILKLLATRPRTAFALIRFGVGGLVPAQKAFKQDEDEKGMRLFGDAVLGPGIFDSFPEQRKQKIRDNLPNIKAELLGPGFAPLEAEQLRTMHIPVLLTSGEKSIGLFQRMTDRLEELLPNARRTWISDASHNMPEANPEAYNETVLSFLTNSHHDG